MKDTWRLILDPPAGGAWNMAVDEAILDVVGNGDSLPTLRLYGWNPACLSMGFAQPLEDVDIPKLYGCGWELVRRITGGRAVLHIDEITYSICAPYNEPRVAGTVVESYHRLGAALKEALSLLGLKVELKEKAMTSVKPNNPVCFDVPSTYEMTFHGKKLIGSAQARRKEGVLQHGSLPLTGDLTRILQVLKFPNEDAQKKASKHLLDQAITLEHAVERKVSWQEAAYAITLAFQNVFSLDIQQGELNSKEVERASQLVDTKYIYPEKKQSQLY
jgi:lipoate-protein ligase A